MSPHSSLIVFLCCCLFLSSLSATRINEDACGSVGRLVKKEERRVISSSEYGEISAVEIGDGTGKHYHLQFIRLDPNSLFLPVLLHAEMVFYVHTGTGRLSWTDDNDISQVKLRRGDVFRLRSGTIFYIQSSLEPERERLRINAIFANSDDDLEEPSVGVYSSINDLIRGFDKRVLQAAFKVPEEVIEELTSEAKAPAIVHAVPTGKKNLWEEEVLFVKAFLGMGNNLSGAENKKKNSKTFNFFNEDPDVENCNGWSKMVTRKNLHALRGSHIGVFMVNLTKGVMMGPHWNPVATEISIVLQGKGMVRVVCPSALMESGCSNSRFRIREGDVFTVPRFHPMAQISFNNESLVFIGFSTTSKNNHPQFLAGKASVLRVLDKRILEASFSVANTTIDRILKAQIESVILECTSCAEEEEMLLEREIGREREEEERRREEEEERKREEEERKKKEEEERKREEEEWWREEEKRRQEEREEEERRREEAAAARQREEEKRRQEQEKAEEEKEEEEQRQREEEEEERRRREEEEEERREEEETEEEAAMREEEERAEEERQQEAAARMRRGEEESQERMLNKKIKIEDSKKEEEDNKRENENGKRVQQKFGHGSNGEGRRILKNKS